MKKFFISFLSLALCFVILTSAGCSRVNYLSFNNDFNGDAGEPSTLIETLYYDVAYTDNYGEGLIKKDNSITDEIVKYRYENGSYVSALEVISFLPSEITTDIDTSNTKIYHLKSTLNIDFVYDVNDGNGEKVHNEKIENEVYFLPAGFSFAPIWSNVKATYSYVTLSSTNANVVQNSYEFTIKYNQKSYTVDKSMSEQALSNSYEYDYRTVIDNTTLLFTIRSLGLETEAKKSIPVVSPAYGESTKLAITNSESMSTKINVRYNGGEVSEQNVAVKNINYLVDSINNAGSPQYVLLQSSATDNLPMRALPVVYAETLTTYGSFSSLGALVYTLKAVTVE